MKFDSKQWIFLTKTLGLKIDLKHAPSGTDTTSGDAKKPKDTPKPSTTSDDAPATPAVEDAKVKSAARVKVVTDLKDDQTALTGLATAFNEGATDPEFIKSAATKLDAVTAALKTVGRSQGASGMTTAKWNTHVAAVRATADDTRDMRGKIKTMLDASDALDPDLVKELKVMQAKIDDALMEVLDLEPAHGPTNHVKINRDGAGKRALLGQNPRTGNTNDKAAHATKFTSPTAFVDALEAGLASPEMTNAIAAITDVSDPKNPTLTDDYVKFSLKLEDVFGSDYKDKVEGQTVVGSGSNRTALKTAMSGSDNATADTLLSTGGMGVAATDLTDGTISFGFFYKDGKWELSTIHPEVAKSGGAPVIPRPSTPDLRFDRAKDRWLKKDPARSNAWHPYDPESDTWTTT